MGESTRYHSPARAEQARQNRRAVLDAAHDLFVEQGFGATTIEQIADRAGVSKPTVFNAVGNKVEVFRTVLDIAMAGDGEPHRLSLDARDLDTAVTRVADYIAQVCRRYAPLHRALSGAAGADPAMAELYEAAELQRYETAGQLLGLLEQHAHPLRPRARARTQDRLWVLMAPDNYARLVGARGWSHRAYREWLTEAICGLLA
jgi:AcrR family transcriptional regulator